MRYRQEAEEGSDRLGEVSLQLREARDTLEETEGARRDLETRLETEKVCSFYCLLWSLFLVLSYVLELDQGQDITKI